MDDEASSLLSGAAAAAAAGEEAEEEEEEEQQQLADCGEGEDRMPKKAKLEPDRLGMNRSE